MSAVRARAYQEFLRGEAWERAWLKVAVRSDFACELCGHELEHVHHLTYSLGWLPPLRLLLGVCGPCHARLHGKEHYRSWQP